jgi:alkyl hydroperoxide reductase subunit AhpF
MGWVAPVASAVTAVTSVAAARQASETGAYNKAIADRNFRVKVQEAEQIERQKEFDIAQFDKKFTQLQGQTKTAVLKSGAELSGSGLRILRSNAREAEIEKDLIEYNSKIAQSRKFEEANFARMQGEIAKQQARTAEFGYYAQAGTSLLRGFGEA